MQCSNLEFIDDVKADDKEPEDTEADPEDPEADLAKEGASTEPSYPKKQKVDETNLTEDRTTADQYQINEEAAEQRFDPTMEEEALIREFLLLNDYVRQVRRETGMYERTVVKRKRDLKEQRRRAALIEKIQTKEDQVAERQHLIKTALTEEDRQERREEDLDRRTRFRQTMEQLNVDMTKSAKTDQEAKVRRTGTKLVQLKAVPSTHPNDVPLMRAGPWHGFDVASEIGNFLCGL
ncbi:hypothetical protein RvY_00730-3 [Ramazzottius varieornatus]|uniref:Uncharacterized protein n=1 Tax=Ramazzottius varieornatus TaxID=947166 RepID=A0A1D1UNL8_RAMVA|nr:hypothetical protein RvY_00730-3 [Ramazzottius varieornatus]